MATIHIPIQKCENELLVSSEDSDLMSRTWLLNRYVKTAGRPHEPVHRLVLERKIGRALMPGEYADHANNDIFDNTRENLRVATASESVWNRRKFTKPSKSGYTGVYPVWGCNDRWSARIALHNQRFRLGTYDSALEAAYVYDQFALQLRGAFASLNVLDHS